MRHGSNAIEISAEVREELDKLALAHRILEMEGQGDMTLGHMSLRDPEGRGLWLKHKNIGLGETLSWNDFMLLDFDGNRLTGEGMIHHEWPIHSEIMARRPEITSVAHTHPFYGCVFSATEEELRPVALEGGYFHPGVPHDKSTAELVNTKELGRSLANALGDAYAVFMKNHGVTFCGQSVEHATMMGLFLERACKAQLLLAASGMKWSSPSDEEMARRRPQTFHSGLIERSWAFYCHKLRWFASANPMQEHGFFRL